MSAARTKQSMARVSLYTAVKFTCLSQSFKSLFTNLIKDCISSLESCRLALPARLKLCACKVSQGVIKHQSTFDQCPTRLPKHVLCCGRTVRRAVRRRLGPEVASLLTESEHPINKKNSIIRVIAAQNRLLLQQDFHLIGTTKKDNELRTFLCLAGAFSGRLQDRSGTLAVRKGSCIVEKSLSGELICDKLAAHFEHTLGSLRQDALEVIIRYYLNIIEAHFLHLHLRWQHSNRIGEGWFAEWPNGRRPLSTTWPWNIKPSLLVLWGVCWMFYGPGDNRKKPTRNLGGAANLGEDFRTGHPGGDQSQPSQPNLSEAWAGPASSTHPNYSWLHPTRAGVARHASTTHTRDNTLPTSYATNAPSYPHISTSSSSSSDLYSTSTVWPYCQSINPDSSLAYAPTYTPWQPQSSFDLAESVVTTPQFTDRSNINKPYAQPTHPANTRNLQVAAGGQARLGFGLGLHISDMQDYPSPGSSTTEQTSSSYVSVIPSRVISPGISLMPSPSLAGGPGSHQSRRRSQEPPRNTEGLLYCDHTEHAQEQPPVFSRKCEWRKHMDKHERPYVCEEPECDNIRGFTYSGGLLRHQREVHRQHGGPKASCMCPYPDCKRHVGVGFSRKENLAEHLRRVHRDAGDDTTPREGSEGAQSTSTTVTKRRRAVPDDDDDGDEDLKVEVKKLKKQLQEKNDRLERLERQMQLLVRSP